jgi:hypothetical protein
MYQAAAADPKSVSGRAFIKGVLADIQAEDKKAADEAAAAAKLKESPGLLDVLFGRA